MIRLIIAALLLPLTCYAASNNFLGKEDPAYVLGKENAAIASVSGVTLTQAASDVAISDNFNRADNESIGASWSEVVTTGSGFDINNDVLRYTTGTGNVIAIHQTPTLAANQYLKYKILNKDAGAQYGFVSRYTNSSSPFYIVELAGTGTLTWYRCASTAMSCSSVGATTLSHATNDTLAVTISGTGASTVLNFWLNQTANLPVSATEWDAGDSTPDATLTDDPASAVDTGTSLGIDANQGSNGVIRIDDFFAGDIP